MGFAWEATPASAKAAEWRDILEGKREDLARAQQFLTSIRAELTKWERIVAEREEDLAQTQKRAERYIR